MRDFTLRKYEELLMAIPRSCTVAEFLTSKPKKAVILRHDVDRSATKALRMAELEAKHGKEATYYFRVKTYDRAVIARIKSLGHEVGYHYEVLDEAKGDLKKAKDLFQKHLRLFPGCKTCAMHGNPLTKWDNRHFWKTNRLSDFGLLGEAYLSFDFKKVTYFTDTGRRWNSKDCSIKDNVDCVLTSVKDTDDLIRILPEKNIAYVLTHPLRWNDGFLAWTNELVVQNTKNAGKRILR
jgi:hypothetical protein